MPSQRDRLGTLYGVPGLRPTPLGLLIELLVFGTLFLSVEEAHPSYPNVWHCTPTTLLNLCYLSLESIQRLEHRVHADFAMAFLTSDHMT